MLATVRNLILFCFTLLLIKAPVSWGFSISRTEQYLQQATEKKLYLEKKWLRLGHYEKTYFGYQSNFRGPLFLDADGFKSPEKELQETIRAFFTDNYKARNEYQHSPQCQFLARRNWLLSQLNIANEDILPCVERENWKKQLSATSVALVFASADLGNPASSFGHTFIKLINPANAKNKDLIDYGVNYAANANESDFMYAFRGLFGFYGGLYTMLPYHQKIREYVNLEGRDLVEYQLNLTLTEVDELINHLLELEKSTSPYHFLSDNCSYQLLVLLEVIRPELNMSDRFTWWVIPIDTIKTVFEKSNLMSNQKHKKSLNTDYLESFSKLSYLQKKALDEAVEVLTIPHTYELTSAEKSSVYETAMKYYAVKAYRTGEDLDQKKYDLAIQRAQLGQTEDFQNKNKIEFKPEQSHDSSAIYLGRGQVAGSNYTSFKFRSSFHDLEQVDQGQVPMSLNNVFTADIRYYDNTEKWAINRFTLMYLLNTTPVTQLDQNLSWKARLDLYDQWRPDIEYGAGYSFELGYLQGTRLAQLISARYTTNGDQPIFQLGPEIFLITRPTQKLGVSFDLSYFAEYKNIPYLRFQTQLNYKIRRNLDFQLSADDRKDYQIKFLHNFIF